MIVLKCQIRTSKNEFLFVRSVVIFHYKDENNLLNTIYNLINYYFTLNFLKINYHITLSNRQVIFFYSLVFSDDGGTQIAYFILALSCFKIIH